MKSLVEHRQTERQEDKTTSRMTTRRAVETQKNMFIVHGAMFECFEDGFEACPRLSQPLQAVEITRSANYR